MEKVKVSIITVGMNHLKHIKNLYKSIYVDAPPLVPFETIYVDNCSTDGSVEFLKENYPQVKIIVNKDKKGFGENNNIGAKVSKGEYLAIINPDVVMQHGSIDKLCEYADNHKEVGVVAPKLLDPDGSLQYSVRGFITLNVLFWRLITKGNDNKKKKVINNYLCKNIDHSKTQFANWVSGASFIIRKEIFDKVSGFDTDYFLYMEDEDLCLRVWKSGYSIVYHPESKMIHAAHRSSLKPSKSSIVHIKSMIKFFKKNGLAIKDYTKVNKEKPI